MYAYQEYDFFVLFDRKEGLKRAQLSEGE